MRAQEGEGPGHGLGQVPLFSQSLCFIPLKVAVPFKVKEIIVVFTKRVDSSF